MDKQRKKILLAAGIVILIVLVAVPLINLQSGNRRLNALLDLGEKYLEDLQYESAIAVFDEAIAIEPKCAKAYLGKARAQYALELYQDAIDTLREGIEKVDDSTELEAFLQQILNELSANNNEVSTTEMNVEEVHAPVMLNYTYIVRSTETDSPTIQLEVLGDNDENYVWESTNPECVTVSDTGLVTCLPVDGYASIIVTAEDGKDKGDGYWDQCEIRIYDPDQSSETESERVRIAINDKAESQKQYMVVELSEEEEGQMAEIIKDVYFSGDISIPEQLTYHNETIPITNISSGAFYWSYEMKSIFIPAFVESVGGGEYYSQNPFGFCLDLEEIKVDEGNAFFQVVDGVLYSKDGKQLISYPAAKSDRTYTIPGEVEKIYSDAFAGCSNLEEILVEDGNQYYESIDGALIDRRTDQLIAYPAGNKAVSYTVPESVTAMASGVFYGSALEEVVCRAVEQIDSGSFLGCDKLKKIECGQGARYINMSMYGKSEGVELTGLNAMENLEVLSLSLSETQDVDAFAALKNLKRLSLNVNGRAIDLQVLGSLPNLTDLDLRGMDHVKDISWIAGMENIEYFNCYMGKSEIKDLTPLLESKNLKSVSMYSQEEVTDEKVRKQIEEIKAERPDVNFSIFE